MPALAHSARTHHRANGLALDEYFDRCFRPEHLPAAGRSQLAVYRDAIAWLRQLLQRAPLLGDLTADNVFRLQRFIADQNFSKSHRRRVQSSLSAIAHHAWRQGLLPTAHLARRYARRTAAPDRAAPPASDALEYYVRQFADDLGITAAEKSHTLTAIHYFDGALGRYSTLADVNDATLAAVFATAGSDRPARDTLQTYRSRVIRVAKAACGERPPKTVAQLVAAEAAPPGTLRRFYYDDYEVEKMVGLCDMHVRYHRSTQALFARYAGRDVPLAEMSNKLAANFCRWMLETPSTNGRPRNKCTVNNHRGRLLSVWRFAHERGLTPEEPRVPKLKVEWDVPDAWTEEECRRIIDAAPHVVFRRWRGAIPAPELFRALLYVVYYTAIRKATLFKLDLASMDLSTGWLSVPGKFMKNRQGKKFRIGADGVAALAAIAHYPRQKLFPWEFATPAPFDRHFHRLLDYAGIPPSTRLGPNLLHKLRRSTATIVAAKKGLAEAAALLGHSNVEVTRRYIDPSKLPGADATEFLPMLTPLERPSVAQELAGEIGAEIWLVDAAKLFDSGWLIQSGVTCRIAIERALQARGRHVGLHKGAMGSVTLLAKVLHSRGYLDAAMHRLFGKLIDRAHKLAHGVGVTPDKIAELLAGTRQFVSTLVSQIVGADAGIPDSVDPGAEPPATAIA